MVCTLLITSTCSSLHCLYKLNSSSQFEDESVSRCSSSGPPLSATDKEGDKKVGKRLDLCFPSK